MSRRRPMCEEIGTAPQGADGCSRCSAPHGGPAPPRVEAEVRAAPRPVRAAFGRSVAPDIDAALQHIEEARQFSSEAGGADRVVKDWLFGLSPREIAPIMEEYEGRYGFPAREYAEVTLPAWKSGVRQMSGMVAERFFRLLPSYMPLNEKYRVARRLWEHFGPSSELRLRVDASTPDAEVRSVLRRHVEAKMEPHSVPADFKRRFDWLTADDVAAKENILNRLLADEADLVIGGAARRVRVLRNHGDGRNGRYVRSWCEKIKIGKHEIAIEFDRAAGGAAPPRARSGAPVGPAGGRAKAAPAPGRRDRVPAEAAPPSEEQDDVPWFWIAIAAGASLLGGGVGAAMVVLSRMG